MTESLKSLLGEQAASVAFKPPDLDAIAHDHTRHVRRRRAVTALAAVAVVAVMASAAIGLSARNDRRPDLPANPLPTTGASWAMGSTIHSGGDAIEAGHEVHAYVRTSVGFVTVDRSDNVYSVTSQGVTLIGRAAAVPAGGGDRLRLVSDPRGTLAGWVAEDQSALVLRIHDQATGQTRSYETARAIGFGGVSFFAIDDRTAYWRIATRDAVLAVDVDTGTERLLASGDRARNLEIWSVEGGVLAFSPDHQPGGNVTSISVGRSIDETRTFTLGENNEANDEVRLSPTGAWLAYLLFEFDGPPQHDVVRAFTAQVRNASTGDLAALNVPATSLVIPVTWLGDSTLQVLGIGMAPGQTVQQGKMYACEVPSGSCEVAADLPAAALEGSGLVLPNGHSVED
jgi:hypothetical protein